MANYPNPRSYADLSDETLRGLASRGDDKARRELEKRSGKSSKQEWPPPPLHKDSGSSGFGW